MKIKKVTRKLGLKKETVSNLNTGTMGKVKGGACTCIHTGCQTYITMCPPRTEASCDFTIGCPTFDVTCFC